MNPQYPDGSFRHPDALTPRPPAPVEPGHHKTQPPAMPRPPKRHKGLFGRAVRLILWLGLLAVLIYSALLVTIVAKISTNPLNLATLKYDGLGRANLLVLGVGDEGHAGQNLTDTVMVMQLDRDTHRVAQISLPRDLRVPLGDRGYGKVNSAHAYGGVELAEQSVGTVLGIDFSGYVKTDFSGLVDLVDAVGGVDVDVKQDLIDSEYPCEDNQYKSCGLRIEAGMQHFDGATALQYARCRKGTCGNDFGRAERQQEILRLLRPKLTDPMLLVQPGKLRAIATALNKNVETDLGLLAMLQFAVTWQSDADNRPINLVLSTKSDNYLRPDPAGSSDLLPKGGDFDAIQEAVQNLFVTD